VCSIAEKKSIEQQQVWGSLLHLDEPRGLLQQGSRAYTFLIPSYRARWREHNDLF
jgi:hypothetical protein